MGSVGYAVNAVSVVLIIFFNIMFMFRMHPPYIHTYIPHPISLSAALTERDFASIRLSDHSLDDELQQRHPRRCLVPHHGMVVRARAEAVPGAEIGKSLRGREDCRDAQGWTCGVSSV